MEPQAGGACRAGNIYNLLQRVLYRMVEQGQLEYAQIPVISLNLMGEENIQAFALLRHCCPVGLLPDAMAI